jgi:hypothetical protein
MKPRALWIRKEWVIVEWSRDLASGGRLFIPLGAGKTVEEAWRKAYPRPWWKFWA